MASHMGVQSFATTRNAQVEGFVDFILELYCESLLEADLIEEYELQSQIHYESELASDIWDHFVCFYDKALGRKVQLWCQTTCYKGNKAGKPEPNKTYEVRETLVEAISIREKVVSSEDIIRTIHFTVGPKKYTYDWFSAAKENTFDKSLYLDLEGVDVFAEIAKSFKGVSAEFQLRRSLQSEIEKHSKIGELILSTKETLLNWHKIEAMPVQNMANQQYFIVANELESRKKEMLDCIKKSVNSGMDIKGRANNLVHGSNEKDQLIIETVELLLEKKPFIKAAQSAIKSWDNYSSAISEVLKNSRNLTDFVKRMWTIDDNLGLVLRRLLLRINSQDSIRYIQDLDIEGVTEHNLYKGNLTSDQLNQVVAHVVELLGKMSPTELYGLLVSHKAKQIIRNSIWFEAKNGTSLKPSFDYIGLALKRSGYRVENLSILKDKAIGFHSEFAVSGEKVNPYTNLKIIINSENKVVAFLKGKYFRQQEFPRRCKEEAYVSLTLKYKLEKSVFSKRYGIPFIMFVDMASDLAPPAYALKRLCSFGWSVAFNKEDILRIIE